MVEGDRTYIIEIFLSDKGHNVHRRKFNISQIFE